MLENENTTIWAGQLSNGREPVGDIRRSGSADGRKA